MKGRPLDFGWLMFDELVIGSKTAGAMSTVRSTEFDVMTPIVLLFLQKTYSLPRFWSRDLRMSFR